MKTLLYMVSFFSIIVGQSYAQNLAPNGFFENRDTCPYDMGQVRLSQGWQTASGTPDYFNCTFRGLIVSTLPHQGDGYMCFYGGKQAAIDWYYYSENSKAKLLSPLRKGRKYRVNFYCGLDLYGVKDSFLDFGLYFFSGKLRPDSAKIGFFYKPQVSVNMRELPIHSYNFYDFCFQADKDYDSILLGPFANSNSNLMPNSPMSSYYFMLDDLEIIPNDTVDFKADKTVICDSGFVNFSIQNFNPSYQYFWILPGSTIDSMHNYAARPVFYNKPGKYPVSLISFGNCNDTVIKNSYIEVIARGTPIDLVLDNNILVCKSEKYTIHTANNRKVQWGNGVISDSLNVTSSGKYTCKFYTGCDTIYDTVIVDFYPRIDFKADKTTFCDSGVVNFSIINPSNTFTCMWQLNGGIPNTSRMENPENIRYSNEGNFDVTLIVDRPCLDTIKKTNLIQVIKKLHDRNLVEPLLIEKCDYETIEVKTKNNVPVKWSNGQVSTTIQVTKAGKYSCSYINLCDTIIDSFMVNFRPECPCEAFLPNSFSPNNDQFNDYFSLNGYVENMSLNVYNRVGEKVFTSTDKKFKWDGKYKGELVPSGVFIYSLSYTNCLKEEKFKTGSINVLY